MESREKLQTKSENPFSGKKYIRALGRRKTSSAVVQIFSKGKGDFFVNKIPALQYFGIQNLVDVSKDPIVKVGEDGMYDINAKVSGGGKISQSQAIRLAIARALVSHNEEVRPQMRSAGYLTVDRRVKERKKPGLKRARRAPQWSKR